MAVFDWVESPGTSLSEEPRVASSRFGDGYEERAPQGLNPIVQRWSLAFREVDDKVAQDIVDFLRARVTALAFESFDWTPLWSTTAIKVVCKKWSRTQPDEHGISDISAAFEQVYEP